MKKQKLLFSLSLSLSLIGIVSVSIIKASPDTILFQNGFESGMSGGNFVGWTSVELLSPSGLATAEDDTSIFSVGSHSAKFTHTGGANGGWALARQAIPWPANNKLWYSCDMRFGSQTNVNLGGIYVMQGFIQTGAWRDRVDLELVNPQANLDGLEEDLTFSASEQVILRMAYRGVNGQRNGHRQHTMVQAPYKNTWYHLEILADLSGPQPRYAWWLDGRFIWQDIDTSTGTDTDAPTHFDAGITNVDWSSGNYAQVWADNCTVSDFGPEPGSSSTTTPTPTFTPTPTPTTTPTSTPTPAPACVADSNSNGAVEIGDINAVLFYWGQTCSGSEPACVADINANHLIEIGDISGILYYWGLNCN